MIFGEDYKGVFIRLEGDYKVISYYSNYLFGKNMSIILHKAYVIVGLYIIMFGEGYKVALKLD